MVDEVVVVFFLRGCIMLLAMARALPIVTLIRGVVLMPFMAFVGGMVLVGICTLKQFASVDL